MNFRQSQTIDLEILSSWFDSELAARYWGGPSISYPLEVERLKSEIQWSENQSYSLTENGSLVGFAQIANKFNCNHICRVLIKPDMRGKQLGKRIMESVLNTHKSSSKNYSLFVYNDNEIAINLYKKLGFHINQPPEGQTHMGKCLFMVKKIVEENSA